MKQLLLALSLSALLSPTAAFAHPERTADTSVEALEEETGKDIKGTDKETPFNAGTNALAPQTKLETHFETYSKELKSKMLSAGNKTDQAVENFSQSFDFDAEALLSDPENIREAAKNFETLIVESGFISNFANILADFAEDIDIETTDGGVTLNFDGETLGRIDTDTPTKNGFELEAMGKNMTVEKQVILKDGKTKTRFVIEMDGGEDIDLKIKPKEKPSGF